MESFRRADESVLVSIDPDLKFKTAERGLMPVQLIFCLKEKNVHASTALLSFASY